MRNSTLLTFFLFVFLSSCGQTKVDTDKAFEFLDAINAQISSNKSAQQKFIDKMTVAILAVRDNKNASIDTKELQSLLEFSKRKNIEREKNIERLIEVDNDINLKEKTLKYVKVFNDAYQNEFPQTIQIFSEKSGDRFERAKEILFSILQSIKEKEVELKNAQKAFETKYTELSKSQPKRTGADYEFIKLKNFKFVSTKIKDGSKIELLSFSGGEDISGDKIYYKQFIGIETSTGDTLRILALATLQQYDLDKALRIGTYKTDLPIRNQMTASESEYIIFNKNQADIEMGNYKTVFGILSFDE